MKLVLVATVTLWVGATLLLSQARWFSRPSLADRLRPYAASSSRDGSGAAGMLSVASFRDVVGPLSQAGGERLARVLGVNEEIGLRLERIHADVDATAFRVRQIGCTAAAFAVGLFAAVVVRLPAGLGFFVVLGAPALAFLLVEHQLSRRSTAWQHRLSLELPVVSEQLAMLLGAGYSLGAALQRIADRGTGVCARDLTRVCGRVRQGLTEVEALREWAAVARVPALDRLVPVLALNRGSSDLGRLISDEARAIRRDVHREQVETMERRSQQVWIPVTVATLVPGVIFLSIPFIEALRQFGGS